MRVSNSTRKTPNPERCCTRDATPLLVVLAGAYYERTGDRAFIESIWHNIQRAIHWMDDYGDCDDDGFFEYARHSNNELVQQGWKDSDNSVFHHDGAPAEGPIAPCEVQGYAYRAECTAAQFASLLGEREYADVLEQQSKTLKKLFHRYFWRDDIGTYALAVDGGKRPCRVRASSAGHTLFSEIANRQAAKILTRNLLLEDSFSGWGMRTISCKVGTFWRNAVRQRYRLVSPSGVQHGKTLDLTGTWRRRCQRLCPHRRHSLVS